MLNCRIWPQYVRNRIHDTYAYFGGSVIITAISAAAIFRSPTLLNLFSQTGWMSLIATMVLMVGSGMMAQSIPYEQGFGVKQLTWITHCAVMVIHSLFAEFIQYCLLVIYFFIGRYSCSFIIHWRSDFNRSCLVSCFGR